MARGSRKAIHNSVLALLLSASVAQGQDVYFSTSRLIEACRNISTAKTWTDRLNAGQVKQDEIGTMNGAWSDARARYVYLWGFVHGSLLFQPRDNQTICYPDGLASDQLAAVFLAWANANPNKWHMYPSTTVALAFEAAWPCGVSPPNPAPEKR